MLYHSSDFVFAIATGATGTASSQEASEAELEAIAGYWQCRHCTSANRDLGSTACEVCGNAKQASA
jgi:rubredoxin